MNAETVEPIEGELVPYVPPSAPSNLFGASDPSAVIERATEVATTLRDVLRKQKLTQHIGAKDHVLVEGWTLLGSMLGVFPVCVWTRKLDNGWEARVEARTRSGDLVGAAEAMCTRDETRWRSADEYAVRSMAQTRATSKALRQPLGFVVTLAGFEATPAEERGPDVSPQTDSPPSGPRITDAQNRRIGAMLRELNEKAPPPEGVKPWVDEVRDLVGKSSRKDFTKADASRAIEYLQQQLDAAEIPFG